MSGDEIIAQEIGNRALQLGEDNREDLVKHEELCGKRYDRLDQHIEKLSNRMDVMHAENQMLMWSIAKAAIYALSSMVVLMGAGIIGWVVTRVTP